MRSGGHGNERRARQAAKDLGPLGADKAEAPWRSERKRGVPGLLPNQGPTRDHRRFQARNNVNGDTGMNAGQQGRQNAASRYSARRPNRHASRDTGAAPQHCAFRLRSRDFRLRCRTLFCFSRISRKSDMIRNFAPSIALFRDFRAVRVRLSRKVLANRTT
jgi:hypothetical protein